MNNRRSRITIAALVLTTAMAFEQPVALGQATTTAPAQGAPPQELTDPNKMADEAIALLEAGDPASQEAAAAKIQTLARIAPRLPRLQLAYARLMVAAGKGPQAIRYYQQFAQTEEGKIDYRPYAEMGRMYIRSTSPLQAKRSLEQAKEFAPEKDPKTGNFIRAEISMDLAEVLHLLKDDKEALRVAREAATRADTDARIQIKFSRLLQVVSPKETKEIRDVASRGVGMLVGDLEHEPINPQNLQLLREALLIVENTWATEAVNQKDNPEPVYLLSLASQDVAEVNRRLALLAAREYAERAVTLNATLNVNKPEYMIRLAEIEAELGSIRTANERLDSILKADPDNEAALALKARIASNPPRKIGAAAGQ